MADDPVVYRSRVQIERKKGPLRVATLPGEPAPVFFSVHGAIARHYGVPPNELPDSHASTLDYVIAAAGGWMLGTFAGALAARGISPDEGRASCKVEGEVESEQGVLIIKRIHVAFTIVAGEDQRETIGRVHGVFAPKCPVYRSLSPGIQITSSFELRDA